MIEDSFDNDLFFTCSLVEYIARKTHNKKSYIITAIGDTRLCKIMKLADVYHSDNIDKISDEIILECEITIGITTYTSKYKMPDFWEMGRVFQRIVSELIGEDKIIDIAVNTMCILMCSWFCAHLDNYNESTYYENLSYQVACYREGTMLSDDPVV